MSMRDERGFSIVEILVAMGILVTLMAIFIPTFLSQKRAAPNGAVVTAAQTFQSAAAEYLRSYPPVGGADPLLTRGGYSGPFLPSQGSTTGLYGIAGDALVRSWPNNAFTKQPTRVLRGACTTAGQPGDVLLCRPTSGGAVDLTAVRVIAWGQDSKGASAKVYDSMDCTGACRVS